MADGDTMAATDKDGKLKHKDTPEIQSHAETEVGSDKQVRVRFPWKKGLDKKEGAEDGIEEQTHSANQFTTNVPIKKVPDGDKPGLENQPKTTTNGLLKKINDNE